ncbi:MAG TPA: phosphoenolpyruvate carboxylase [Cyclobacteriaceae bacterium]
MNLLSEVKYKLGKPYQDLEYILYALKEVLDENGEEEIAKSIPWINDLPAFDPNQFTDKQIQLYSIIFQIINLVETNGAVQQRRKKEDESLTSINGLWARSFQKLKDAGISEETILNEIKNIRIEPVLTAHPTEAKRATVLEHHRELYLLMVQRENTMFTKKEKENIHHNIKLTLYRLWKTGEIFVSKPDIESELRNILHYLTNVFPEIVPILDRRMLQAWEEVGFDSQKVSDQFAFPHISFGDWVGGDRDGHPLVTADITKSTLEKLRLNAFVVVRRQLTNLVKHLSFGLELAKAPKILKDIIQQKVEELGPKGEESLSRNEGEAFRQMVNLMLTKLPLEMKRGHATQIHEFKGAYQVHTEMVKDLQALKKSLLEFGALSVAYDDVNSVIRTVETFGFHLAALDIRQNSNFHDLAISQLLEAAGFQDSDYINWPEEKRIEFLNHELKSNRPFTHPKTELGDNARAVVDVYTVVRKHIDKYGVYGIGSFIVSMTRSLSDLLGVYILAREAGLTFVENDQIVCKVPVVPLLETIEDLAAGRDIMDKFLSHPSTIKSLKYQKDIKGLVKETQMIMVGYSDSNKDGGIMASQWNLFTSQDKLMQIADQHNVKIRFFHGKGGSISRGSGPTHYFIDALPHSTVNGDIRLTEQGETIEQKYANKVNAEYNLELLAASTVRKTILDRYTQRTTHPNYDLLTEIAAESKKTYSKLLKEEGFIQFFRQATPIDAIENSKIGSRPSRRKGANTLDDLRAIPWVFSWSQARFHMTSWYGVGTTLERYAREQPDKFDLLKKSIKTDPFIRYVLTNVDTSLAATDKDIMIMYGDLVRDENIKEKFMKLFMDELNRTLEGLENVLEVDIKKRRQQHYYSNKLRASILDNLHHKQIDLLTKWRAQKDNGDTGESEKILIPLLMSINAIAGALRNTG